MPPLARRGRRGISPWHLSHPGLPCQEKTPDLFSLLAHRLQEVALLDGGMNYLLLRRVAQRLIPCPSPSVYRTMAATAIQPKVAL